MTDPAPTDPAAGYHIEHGRLWLAYVIAGLPYGQDAAGVALWAGQQLAPHLPPDVVAALVADVTRAGRRWRKRVPAPAPEG